MSYIGQILSYSSTVNNYFTPSISDAKYKTIPDKEVLILVAKEVSSLTLPGSTFVQQ